MFGFGKGKIDIKPEKFNYQFGDTVRGKVVLDMKQSVEAKELRIILKGESKESRTGVGFSGGVKVSHSSGAAQTIFEFKLPLDGQKTYSGYSEYDFEIMIPASAKPQELEGAMGDVVKAMRMLGGQKSHIKWYLNASLDIPGGMDVSKKVNINVG